MSLAMSHRVARNTSPNIFTIVWQACDVALFGGRLRIHINCGNLFAIATELRNPHSNGVLSVLLTLVAIFCGE